MITKHQHIQQLHVQQQHKQHHIIHRENVTQCVDRYHDVCTIRAIAELTESKSYLGCIQCLPYQKPCIYYREASVFSYKYMQHSISIFARRLNGVIKRKEFTMSIV